MCSQSGSTRYRSCSQAVQGSRLLNARTVGAAGRKQNHLASRGLHLASAMTLLAIPNFWAVQFCKRCPEDLMAFVGASLLKGFLYAFCPQIPCKALLLLPDSSPRLLVFHFITVVILVRQIASFETRSQWLPLERTGNHGVASRAFPMAHHAGMNAWTACSGHKQFTGYMLI